MAVQWTTEQQQVIELRNRNILVSAAAGSGKTAVLVQRIITKLTKDELPSEIDKMLIVTYTEAAAAEMKERIRDAIEKELELDPGNEHLQRQATLVHNARVTTIHSFCLSVIREHFHTIDLDPGFRIAEEGELKLLKHDVIQDVLERRYDEGSREYLDFVDAYAAGRDDKNLEELVLKLFEFSRSYPDAEQWLDTCAGHYKLDSMEEFCESHSVKTAEKRVRQYAGDASMLLKEGIQTCQEVEGPYMYEDTLRLDLQVVEKLSDAENYPAMYEVLKGLKWSRIATNRDKSVDTERAEFVKNIRAEVKKNISDLAEQYFYDSPEEIKEDMRRCQSHAKVLTSLVREFAAHLEEQKKEKNLIDFSDMEQYALRILTRKDGDKIVPSEVAKEYQDQFDEVMIDEYQDSNLIQEAILTSVSKVSKGIYNVFMVGDVKQSIYRFRLSRPELFMEKFNTYSQTESKTQRIDLHKNFRSRKEVLDSTNFIFRQIMTKPLGGITYDDKAALYLGAGYAEMPENEAELMVVQTKSDMTEGIEAEDTDRELEAKAVAKRIRELVGNHLVLDKKTGEYRPAKYSDIVILSRGLKGFTDVFAKILGQEGIPAYTGSKEGYFGTLEIGIILDYLRVLDNKQQDLPLAAVMSSWIGGFTSDEMAQIRSSFPELPFYEAVAKYETAKGDGGLAGKLEMFQNQITYFREMVPYTSIHELLYRILTETGYEEYAQAMPGGEQRKANLDMLVEKARSFEKTSYKGLFHFVRYIEQLQKYDVDYGEANIADEQADTVRIMSIHKSKGLEFPIVFVSGMSKRFNTQDGKGSILIHPELGIGLDAVDLDKRMKTPSFLKNVMQKEILNENLGEELRVLYVALTRAKEKLIMTGTQKDFERKLRSYENVRIQEERELSFSQLTKASSYFDWVIPALIRHRSFAEILEQYQIPAPFTSQMYDDPVDFRVRIVIPEELAFNELVKNVDNAFTLEELKNWNSRTVYDRQMQEQLEAQFGFQYPYQSATERKLKFTVSELKKRAYMQEEESEMLYEEPEAVPLVPKFLQKEAKLEGAGRGTAYHRFLELHNFMKKPGTEEVEAEIKKLLDSGKISKEMAEALWPSDLKYFFQTETARRMNKAALEGKLYKEQPFVLGVDVSEVYQEDESKELLLVQGIIDVYFEEEDGIVLLDYKTDYVQSAEELKEKYHSQLDYYAKALERMTQKRVKEKIIYSFKLREAVKV